MSTENDPIENELKALKFFEMEEIALAEECNKKSEASLLRAKTFRERINHLEETMILHEDKPF